MKITEQHLKEFLGDDWEMYLDYNKNRIDGYYSYTSILDNNPEYAISWAFRWDKTTSGFDYWYDLSNKWYKYIDNLNTIPTIDIPKGIHVERNLIGELDNLKDSTVELMCETLSKKHITIKEHQSLTNLAKALEKLGYNNG